MTAIIKVILGGSGAAEFANNDEVFADWKPYLNLFCASQKTDSAVYLQLCCGGLMGEKCIL